MQQAECRRDLKTIIIKYEQQPEGAGLFRIWFQELWKHTVTFKGFKAFEIIPATSGELYHTVLLHFESLEEAQDWMVSPQRAKLLDHKTLYFLSGKEPTTPLTEKNEKPGRKIRIMVLQMLFLFIVMLPISVAIPGLANQLFKGSEIEDLLQASIFALLISLLLIVLIIPLMTWLFQHWPKPK